MFSGVGKPVFIGVVGFSGGEQFAQWWGVLTYKPPRCYNGSNAEE